MTTKSKKPFRKGLQHAKVTLMQESFVSDLVRGGCNPTQAARNAGYADPKVSAYDLLRTAHIQAAIRFERIRLFDSDLANLAATALRDVLLDTNSPAYAKVMAARAVLEHAGQIGGMGEAARCDLHAMSGQELTRELSNWKSATVN